MTVHHPGIHHRLIWNRDPQGVPHNETDISKDRTKGLEYLHEFADNIYEGEAMVVT